MLYKAIFNAAADSNIIDYSPCERISAKGGKPQKDKEALSDEQVEKLLSAIKGLPPYVFVMIGLPIKKATRLTGGFYYCILSTVN